MRFSNLTPNKPQPLSSVAAGLNVGRGARWRNVTKRDTVTIGGVEYIDCLDVHELNLRAAQKEAAKRRGKVKH